MKIVNRPHLLPHAFEPNLREKNPEVLCSEMLGFQNCGQDLKPVSWVLTDIEKRK